MKISRLLSKKYLSFILILFLCSKSFANDKPVDIWNIDNKKNNEQASSTFSIDEKELKNNQSSASSIYKMQTQKQSEEIQLDKIFSFSRN